MISALKQQKLFNIVPSTTVPPGVACIFGIRPVLPNPVIKPSAVVDSALQPPPGLWAAVYVHTSRIMLSLKIARQQEIFITELVLGKHWVGGQVTVVTVPSSIYAETAIPRNIYKKFCFAIKNTTMNAL